MSAIALQFSTNSHKTIRLARGMIDVTPIDKRGFVMFDACVPSWLAVESLHLLCKYQGGNVAPVPHGVKAYAAARYSFSSNSPEHGSLALIEACIPAEMATELCAMATQELQPAA